MARVVVVNDSSQFLDVMRDVPALCNAGYSGRRPSVAPYHRPMASVGALSQAWISAEASLPLGWQIRGLWRFDNLRVSLAEGPSFDDYLSGSGQYAD
jgi:hypothetical protein